MEAKRINHGRCFGNENWYMFYCANCSRVIDMNLKKKDRSICHNCNSKIEYPKQEDNKK